MVARGQRAAPAPHPGSCGSPSPALAGASNHLSAASLWLGAAHLRFQLPYSSPAPGPPDVGSWQDCPI